MDWKVKIYSKPRMDSKLKLNHQIKMESTLPVTQNSKCTQSSKWTKNSRCAKNLKWTQNLKRPQNRKWTEKSEWAHNSNWLRTQSCSLFTLVQMHWELISYPSFKIRTVVIFIRLQICELKLAHSVRHDTVTPERTTIFAADLLLLHLLPMMVTAACKQLYLYILLL